MTDYAMTLQRYLPYCPDDPAHVVALVTDANGQWHSAREVDGILATLYRSLDRWESKYAMAYAERMKLREEAAALTVDAALGRNLRRLLTEETTRIDITEYESNVVTVRVEGWDTATVARVTADTLDAALAAAAEAVKGEKNGTG